MYGSRFLTSNWASTGPAIRPGRNLAAGCPIYADPTALPLEPLYRIPIVSNVFEWAGQRQPRALGRVLLHEVDNIFAFEPYDRGNGAAGTTYGTYASNGAMVSAQSNLYLSAPYARHRPMGLFTTTTPGTAVAKSETEAAIRSEDNLAVADAVVDEHRLDLVPKIGYAAGGRSTPLDLRSLGVGAAMACVIARAGRAGTADWPVGRCRH